MPGMPRPKGKATEIAYGIIGEPSNMGTSRKKRKRYQQPPNTVGPEPIEYPLQTDNINLPY